MKGLFFDWIYKNKRALIFYVIFFLLILALNSTFTGFDYDLWARLIAGKAFVQTGHVLKYDFLSYTPTHIWYDHEWGSSVIFYLVQHFWGSAGLLILQSTLIFLIFFMITKIVEMRGVKTTHPYNFLFYFFTLSAICYLMYSPVRCQLFSFLFFTVFLYILERARLPRHCEAENVYTEKEPMPKQSRAHSLIFALPLLMIIWNNLHGGSVAGIGLIVIYIVGELFNQKPLKTIYPYIYALILTLLVLPIHPLGFKYLIFLFRANTMPRPYIMEWWGLFFAYNIHQYMKFKILSAILIITEFIFIIKNIVSQKFEFDKTKYLLLAVTLFLAIQHAKLVPLFTICAACFLYDDFYTVFNALTKNIFNKIKNIKDPIIYVIILVFIFSNLNYKTFHPSFSWNKYPIRAIEFIKINKIKGKLLTNFGFGSYASYKLYPNNKIFMDGRYEEVYYDYMVPMLKNFYLVNRNWDEVLKKFPPDVMIIEKYYPIYKTLVSGNVWIPVSENLNSIAIKNSGIKHNYHWTLIFEDPSYGVFVKSKDVRKSYKLPPLNIDYYNKTAFYTNIDFKK